MFVVERSEASCLIPKNLLHVFRFLPRLLRRQLEGPENEDLLASLNEITLLVKELEEIRDFGMNAAVIALARQSPRGEAVSFRDIFLREWGTICRQMMESKFNDNQE